MKSRYGVAVGSSIGTNLQRRQGEAKMTLQHASDKLKRLSKGAVYGNMRGIE